jgi:hypothetical protein
MLDVITIVISLLSCATEFGVLAGSRPISFRFEQARKPSYLIIGNSGISSIG